MIYRDFRTGLTFKGVRRMLKEESKRKQNNNERMWVTRHTVLGRMREIKLMMFNEEEKYLEGMDDTN